MEIKCNQTKDLQFPFLFFLYKTKNPEIVENSPKDIEKMISLVKTHDSKKDVICSDQSAKNSKMYVIIFAIR